MIDDRDINFQIKIICSPFLRCFQTANEIAKTMNVSAIEIDFNLSEI
jgi:broad specificity phosphatase PhoE